MHDYHPHFLAIVHDHFCAHNQMENGLSTGQYIPIVNYLEIVGMLVSLDRAHEMYSIAAINHILFIFKYYC